MYILSPEQNNDHHKGGSAAKIFPPKYDPKIAKAFMVAKDPTYELRYWQEHWGYFH